MARTPTSRETPLAQWLEKALQARGWTQRRLAEESTISQPRITQILKGGTPRREALESLAKALFIGNWQHESERFATFYSEAIRAAWPVPDKDDERVKQALGLLDRLDSLQGRDRRIAYELLGPVDAAIVTVPHHGTGSRVPITRDTNFEDASAFVHASADNKTPSRSDIDANKQRIEERRQQREEMDFSPAARQRAIQLIRAWCSAKGDRDIKEIVNLKQGANPELPYQADVKIVWSDDAISDDYFNLSLETGAVQQIVEDEE